MATAPGRVNLIGDHTDYEGGLVLPAAHLSVSCDMASGLIIGPSALRRQGGVCLDMATEPLTKTGSRHLPLTLRLPPTIKLTDEQLLELSSLNRDLRLELTSRGDLIVMPPAGGGSGRRNAHITMQLGVWSERDGRGEVFDSSTGFRLPNGAVRSPDAAWVSTARLEPLSPEVQEQYLPLCPEFLIELRSPTDRLQVLQEKMQEYIDNGARLGWLIDPQQKRVVVYTPETIEELEKPETLSGEPILSGFTLDLRKVWD